MKRIAATHRLDADAKIRHSHRNPVVEVTISIAFFDLTDCTRKCARILARKSDITFCTLITKTEETKSRLV